MKHSLCQTFCCSIFLLTSLPACLAQSTAQTKEAAPAPAVTPEMEAAFEAMLRDATLTGRWCLVKDGALTPEQEDSYKLKGAEKKDGKWTISASMAYAGKEIRIPVPVKVEFAAGSPVIVVDKLWIPGGGTYSARVVFHDDTYAGVWSGGGMRGLLSGFITRPAAAGAK